MNILDNFLDYDPYELDFHKKNQLFLESILKLEEYHTKNCNEYSVISNNWPFKKNTNSELENLPFIPVRLFKDYELKSISDDKIVKTMTSSGTTGQKVSKIFLDSITSINQTKVLSKIVKNYLGSTRLPMLIIDNKDVLKNRKSFSARGAGILGFSIYGYDRKFILDNDFKIDIQLLKDFLKKYKNEEILLFGFTYIIWEYFKNAIEKYNIDIKIPKGILIHGGGWKKMQSQSVDSLTFKKELNSVIGISKIFNYYGMVEQTGSIYMECEHGYFHTTSFSDILIRDPKNFEICQNGKKGLIQLISLLPSSYPGHSILSEDLGVVHGIDNCKCGRKGKYFTIHGRLENAEIRGCSDVLN